MLLLVGALLLCHGILGALHQLDAPAFSDPPAVVEHTSHQEGHGGADEHPPEHPSELPSAAHDYAAVLFALLLGMVYVLSRREGSEVFPAFWHTGSLTKLRESHLPHGIGPPLSQIFRL